MNRYVFITLEWAIYFDIYHGSPFIEVATMFLQQPQIDKLLYKASFRHCFSCEKHGHKDEQVTVIFAMTSVYWIIK